MPLKVLCDWFVNHSGSLWGGVEPITKRALEVVRPAWDPAVQSQESKVQHCQESCMAGTVPSRQRGPQAADPGVGGGMSFPPTSTR